MANALKDVELGFIQGRYARMTDAPTSQSKAMRLLQALYGATRQQTEPVFVSALPSGLTTPETEAAWRYLKHKGLIDTFSLPYTARINSSGIDAIEGATRSPDHPSKEFPAVTYNFVQNTMNVENMSQSSVQQAGIGSSQIQTVTYSVSDLADLRRLVHEMSAHLFELELEPAQFRKATAQLSTLEAQLSDEPDPVIIKQAGRTLRNITEGTIGSLIATAISQTGAWAWVLETLRRCF